MKEMSGRQIQAIKASYPKGTRLELVYTDDIYTKLKPGARGAVDFIDDAGTIFMDWDNGSHLGLIPGIDSFRRIKEEDEK
jgi:hypothetical protein